jgi:hypothetical protein
MVAINKAKIIKIITRTIIIITTITIIIIIKEEL